MSNHYDRIPPEIKNLNQWVCAKTDVKIPMSSYGYEAASSTDPATWSDFSTAVKAVEDGFYDYCGFVFNDNGIVGIDIDTGFEDGLLSPVAIDIIKRCKSYTEKSKSGRGFHILLKGDLPFKGKNNLAGVEIYKASRFFIMTGDTMLYTDVVENQEAIDYIVKTYFPETRNTEKKATFSDRIYNPVWNIEKGRRIKVRPEYPVITTGGRNLSLTSLAGVLHNQGYTKKNILTELIHVNKIACKPPLSNNELKSICNSVTRYAR